MLNENDTLRKRKNDMMQQYDLAYAWLIKKYPSMNKTWDYGTGRYCGCDYSITNDTNIVYGECTM